MRFFCSPGPTTGMGGERHPLILIVRCLPDFRHLKFSNHVSCPEVMRGRVARVFFCKSPGEFDKAKAIGEFR